MTEFEPTAQHESESVTPVHITRFEIGENLQIATRKSVTPVTLPQWSEASRDKLVEILPEDETGLSVGLAKQRSKALRQRVKIMLQKQENSSFSI